MTKLRTDLVNQQEESHHGSSTKSGESDRELARLKADLASVTDQLKAANSQYDELRTSMAYRVGDSLARSPIGALYRAIRNSRNAVTPSVTKINPTVAAVVATSRAVPSEGTALPPETATAFTSQQQTYTEFDSAAVAALPEGAPVSIAHPHWLGIRSSASQLFDHLLLVTDLLQSEDAGIFAELLLQRRPSAVVLQGFPFAYQHIVEALHARSPETPICVVWHGTFMQASEDYAWRSFRKVCELARQGKIRRIGCVKEGQEEILRHQGLDAAFLLNMYRTIPERAAPVAAGPAKLGIWSISELKHKPPYEMLAGASMVPGVQVIGSVASPRMLEFCNEFSLASDFVGHMIPQIDMPRYLAAAHLNLYVTLNECAPMLPLESFAVGVPCIIGPNTPYFKERSYLRERLVVDVPDDARGIAFCIDRALTERDEIIAAYREYALNHNVESARTVKRFLDF